MHILKGHTAAVRCLAYSPDGSLPASGADDHQIKFWNPLTSQERGLLTGHSDWVRAAAFSPDGKQLASAGWDDSVRLWGVVRKSQQAKITGHGGGAWSLAYSPDGSQLATGAGDGTVRIHTGGVPNSNPLTLHGLRWPANALAFICDWGGLSTAS